MGGRLVWTRAPETTAPMVHQTAALTNVCFRGGGLKRRVGQPRLDLATRPLLAQNDCAAAI
jgi:hypothetical protein